MKDKKYFCYEIFKNLAIYSSNGKLKYSPCSLYDGHYIQTQDLDVDFAWNSSNRKKVIELVAENKPVPGCHRCYEEEAMNLKSRRLSSKELYEQFHNNTQIELTGPQGIDYSVGNLCNLKCIICGPTDSSQWVSDYQKIYPDRDVSEFLYQKHNQIEFTGTQGLNNVVNIHFHGGGEPLISNSHVNLLERINDSQGLSNVRVFYNTNGTATVSDKVLELWEKCKLIELYFSIDDIGHRFDYQRTNANFNILSQNLNWFWQNMPHNHMFKVNATWSYLNLYYLDELVDWHKANFATNRYGDPTNLILQTAIGSSRISHASPELKQILLEKFKNYPNLITLVNSLNESTLNHDAFFNWISKIDSIRGTSFFDVEPQWAKLLYDTV